MSFSKTIVVGYVGKDAELTYTPNGIALCKFSVAHTKVSGKGEGRKEETTWFNCTCWREAAETASQWIKKGSSIVVEGEVSVRAYTNRNGEAAASLDMDVRSWSFAGGKSGGNNNDQATARDTGEDASDIPF